MKLVAPDYYKEFSCIADACRHSCCTGWEIDIDGDTYEYYKDIKGDFGKRILNSISIDDEPHFILLKDERCPFLNGDNLCDIIINLGEDSLCQICTDHPRFRNFFTGRTEIGIGMCCEAAGRLILSRIQKTKLAEIEDNGEDEFISDEEQEFFRERDNIFSIVQDRTKSIDKRVESLLNSYNAHIPDKTLSEWADVYLSLEHLDSAWTERVNKLKELEPSDKNILMGDEWEIPFEQVMIYFLYRHLPDGIYDESITQRILFACISFYIIYALCVSHKNKHGVFAIDDLVEICRLYSSEIEYSEDNINTLLGIFRGE